MEEPVEPISYDDSVSEAHIEPKTMEAFAKGTLSADQTHDVTDHLAFCARCRNAFAEAIRSIEVSPSSKNQTSSGSSTDEAFPIISGYHQLERIAQGGMGTIYLAKKVGTEQQVAIKRILLRDREVVGADRKQRLIREAEALTKLNHPNIVRAIEVMLLEDTPAIVMEYVPGVTLHRWTRERNLDAQLAAKLMLQLVDAIEHAHGHGVVHCDLKPQNVLVTTQEPVPKLKLIDFGLAKIGGEDWAITQSGDVLGTPAYMAPEQTTGKVIRAEPAIDIYGLGAILYELLTGAAPFEDSDPSVLLTKIVRERPQGPRVRRPEIPVGIERICLKCLEKRPRDRYGSAQVLANDLQAFLDGRAVRAKPPGVPRKVAELLRHHRGFALGTAIAVLVGILGGLALWKASRSTDELQASLLKAESRVDTAQAAALEELRASLTETSERLFGATPDREDAEHKALEKIAQRWGRFAESIDDTIDGQLVRAESLLRLGSIHAILAEPKEAEEKLQRSLDALGAWNNEWPNNSKVLQLKSEAKWELAKLFFDKGKIPESDFAFLEAIDQCSQANQIDPEDPNPAYLLTRIQRDYGVMLTRSGKLDVAHKQLDASMSVLEHLQSSIEKQTAWQSKSISSDQIIEQMWSTRNAQAMLMRIQGQAASGIELLDSIPQSYSDLESRQPDDPIVLRLRSAHKFTLGLCQMDLNRLDLCKTSFSESISYQKRLMIQYPRRQDLRKNYGNLCGSLGVVTSRLGQPNEAIEFVEESLKVHSELASESPTQPEHLNEKGKSLTNLVAILASVNRLDEAKRYGEELMQIQGELRTRFPDQADYDYAFAASSNILGQIHTKLGQYEEAALKFERSRATYLELTEKHPAVAAYRNGLINTVLSVAELATRNQSWSDAIDAYAKVIQQIVAKTPESSMSDSVLLSKAYLGQAMSFKQLGESKTSRICAELGRNTIESWKDRDATSQELYRRCSNLLK